MDLLAIETSGEIASVALQRGDTVWERRLQGYARHAEHVLPAVQAVLEEAGLAVEQLSAIAFGAGPGAFTGLRLACGVAQGIALAADLGVAAIGSLQALALQVGAARVLVATDARMGEIYCATFVTDAAGVPQPQGVPRCCAPLELELPPGEWSAAGSAFRAWPEELEARTAGRLVACLPDLHPRAEEVARLGAIQARAGRLVAPELAAPLYVRDKVALTTAERRARGGRA